MVERRRDESYKGRVKDSKDMVATVGPAYVIKANDRLFFAGMIDDLEKLTK